MESRAIDWEAIHRRLAGVADAILRGIEPPPDELRRVLEARARVVARRPERAPDVEMLDLLTFSMAAETWGVETRHVREVCQLRNLTALPCTPPFVAGVMSLRGGILAIIDLRTFFGLPSGGLTELNKVIVLRGGNHELGLLADSIEGVRSIAVPELQEGLPTLTGIRERFLRGVTGRMLAVLDGERLLSDAALKVEEQVAE
ncbi:MAG: chemotaxis protein CheW [Thermoanaerobaculia bacterium]